MVADRENASLAARLIEGGLPTEATVAVFYSISNCQPGLAGVSFG